MAAWEILKELDLTFEEVGSDNLDKILKSLTTEDVAQIVSDMNKAKEEARKYKEVLSLAFAIAKTALKTAVA